MAYRPRIPDRHNLSLMLKLNELNQQLQSKCHHIAKMVRVVNAFKYKLKLWKVNLARKSLSYFPNLKMMMSMYQVNLNTLPSISHLLTLQKEFSERFKDFSVLEPVVTVFFLILLP